MFKTTFDQLRQGNLSELFSILEAELIHQEIDFYLIGAIARDIWLSGMHGIDPVRITRDLDLAVLLASEEQYRYLHERLIETGRFIASRDSLYTLIFDDGRPVDLLPFGAISMEQAVVSLPGKGLTNIQVDGFQEVYEVATEPVKVDDQSFQVCTLAGIVLLKLIAYDDRPEHRLKDIQDIGLILRHYFDIAESDIFEYHNDLFDADDYDITQIAAQVLGRQIHSITKRSKPLQERIEGILDKQIGLGEDSNVAGILVWNTDWSITYTLNLLRQLRRGLEE